MGIEIPDELQWVAKYVLGAGDWPDGDETAMRRVADGWTAMANTLNTVDDEAAAVLNAVLSAISEGETHTAITTFRDKLLAGDQAAFTAVRKWCQAQAELLEDGANDIEHTKLVIIGTMIVTAVELAVALATSWTGVGAVAGVAARVAAQVTIRMAIKQLIARMLTRGAAKAAARLALRGALWEALEEGGVDLAARVIQVANGDRTGEKFGLTDLGLATFGGAVGGAVGGVLGGGTGALGDVASSTTGKVASKVVGGAVTELGADVSAQVAAAGVGAAFLGREFQLDIGVDTFTSAGAGGVQSAIESSGHSGNPTAPTVPELGSTAPGATSPAGTGTPSEGGTQSPTGSGSPSDGAPTTPAATDTGPTDGSPTTPTGTDTGSPTTPASTSEPGAADAATSPQSGSPDIPSTAEPSGSGSSNNGANGTPAAGDSAPPLADGNGAVSTGTANGGDTASPSPAQDGTASPQTQLGDSSPSSPNNNGSTPASPVNGTDTSLPTDNNPASSPGSSGNTGSSLDVPSQEPPPQSTPQTTPPTTTPEPAVPQSATSPPSAATPTPTATDTSTATATTPQTQTANPTPTTAPTTSTAPPAPSPTSTPPVSQFPTTPPASPRSTPTPPANTPTSATNPTSPRVPSIAPAPTQTQSPSTSSAISQTLGTSPSPPHPLDRQQTVSPNTAPTGGPSTQANPGQPNHNQARALRESLRNLPSQDGHSPAVDANRNPFTQRPPAYRVRRFQLGDGRWVAVASIRAHIPNAHLMSPNDLRQAVESIQEIVDATFNDGSKLLSGDLFLVDLEFTNDLGNADLALNPSEHPNRQSNILRDHLGLFPAEPGATLNPDDLREISNDIARANTPTRFADPADSRIVDHNHLDDVESPTYQAYVEDLLRAGNSFIAGADPRTHPYGQAINDGGREQPGRGNNCLDCSLSALSSFFGMPRIAAPRWPDYNQDGTPDSRSGEADGNERAAAWIGSDWASYSGTSVDAEYESLHNYIESLGPGSAALVATGWHARDENGNRRYNADGTPVIEEGHATVIVFPPGASGPVWWDPQSGETSDRPPASLTAEAAAMWCIPIDANGGPLNGGTSANPGTSPTTAGPSIRPEQDVQHRGEQPRLGMSRDAPAGDPTPDRPPYESGYGELRGQQAHGSDHSPLEHGYGDDRQGIRPDDRSRAATPGLPGVPETTPDSSDPNLRGPEHHRLPGAPDVPDEPGQPGDHTGRRDQQEPDPAPADGPSLGSRDVMGVRPEPEHGDMARGGDDRAVGERPDAEKPSLVLDSDGNPLPSNRLDETECFDGEYTEPVGEEWNDVRQAAVETADSSTRPPKSADDPKMAAALQMPDGRIFTGRSQTVDLDAHPELRDLLDSIPSESQSRFAWGCAEIDCIAQALAAGYRLEDLRGALSSAAMIRGFQSSQHGRWREPCGPGDKFLLGILGIRW